MAEQVTLETLRGELKAIHEDFGKEVKKVGADVAGYHEKTNTKIEALQKVLDEKVKEIDDLKAKMNRPGSPTNAEKKFKKRQKNMILNRLLKGGFHTDYADFYAKSFDEKEKAWLHKGWEENAGGILIPESQKAMALGVDIAGGYLAPMQFVNNVIQGIVVVSPVREYATVYNTTQVGIKMPVRTQRANVSKKVENASNNENTNIQFGIVQILTKEYISIQIIPNELLQDSMFNLEQLLVQNMSIEYAAAQGTDFISGDGKNAPEGILTNTNVSVIKTASTATFVAADLFSLMYGIKESYAMQGVWMANRSTIGYIRKMVSTTGQFLWQPGLDGGQAAMLAGRPIREAPDMTAVTPSTGQNILIFGDFRRGYGIVDRVGMTMLRDPYSLSSSTQTKYVFTMRTGGAVLDTAALAIMQVK